MSKRVRYSEEVRQRAVRMVFEHENEYCSKWQAIQSIASKIGYTPESLRKWVKQNEIDDGKRDGMTTEDRKCLKELEKESRELKKANEILRKASAYFALAELDHPNKK